MNVLPSTELLNAIYGRRAVRKFTGEQIARPDLERLITTATQAPSAMNLQPWAFAVVQGADRLAEYSERSKRYLMEQQGLLAGHAPC
jgi:nitroreductase